MSQYPLADIWFPKEGGITFPKGFKASGIKAGLKSSGKPDLALLLAPEGAVCSGSFTQSAIRAACVDLCLDRLQSQNGLVRAVLINSGQANACTGERGLLDSLKATKTLSRLLQLKTEEVLICSTGVIGQPIPIISLLSKLEDLVCELNEEGGLRAAQAILTTDLREKEFAFQAELGGKIVRIGGMAKGSGMIHPNMATMLGYLTCDAYVPQPIWSSMIERVVNSSFNLITVDGDTSTNDSLIAFASGQEIECQYWDALEIGLTNLAQQLAKAIARDGEGANCLIEVQVDGSDSINDARTIARTICSSALVKTAVHGKDPNWGRIVAAAGNSGVPIFMENISLWIGPYQLIRAGVPLDVDQFEISHYMNEKMNGIYLETDTILIKLNVGKGSESGVAWGCDLSDQYVRINADYTT